MRLQINLSVQIGDVELADIVPKERDRHDQRHQAASVVLDKRDEFVARISVEMRRR